MDDSIALIFAVVMESFADWASLSSTVESARYTSTSQAVGGIGSVFIDSVVVWNR